MWYKWYMWSVSDGYPIPNPIIFSNTRAFPWGKFGWTEMICVKFFWHFATLSNPKPLSEGLPPSSALPSSLLSATRSSLLPPTSTCSLLPGCEMYLFLSPLPGSLLIFEMQISCWIWPWYLPGCLYCLHLWGVNIITNFLYIVYNIIINTFLEVV